MRYSTYISASEKLRNLGFKKRAEDLKTMGVSVYLGCVFENLKVKRFDDINMIVLCDVDSNRNIIEYDTDNNRLLYDFDIWRTLRNEINLKIEESQNLIEECVEIILNIKLYNPEHVIF